MRRTEATSRSSRLARFKAPSSLVASTRSYDSRVLSAEQLVRNHACTMDQSADGSESSLPAGQDHAECFAIANVDLSVLDLRTERLQLF